MWSAKACIYINISTDLAHSCFSVWTCVAGYLPAMLLSICSVGMIFFMQKCKVRAYVVLCCGPEVCELIGVGVYASVCLCICGFCWVSVATLCFPPVPVCGCNAEWRSFLWSVQGLSMGEGWVEFSRGEGGMFNMGRVLLQSVHPLIWDTHLCLLVF